MFSRAALVRYKHSAPWFGGGATHREKKKKIRLWRGIKHRTGWIFCASCALQKYLARGTAHGADAARGSKRVARRQQQSKLRYRMTRDIFEEDERWRVHGVSGVVIVPGVSGECMPENGGNVRLSVAKAAWPAAAASWRR